MKIDILEHSGINSLSALPVPIEVRKIRTESNRKTDIISEMLY